MRGWRIEVTPKRVRQTKSQRPTKRRKEAHPGKSWRTQTADIHPKKRKQTCELVKVSTHTGSYSRSWWMVRITSSNVEGEKKVEREMDGGRLSASSPPSPLTLEPLWLRWLATNAMAAAAAARRCGAAGGEISGYDSDYTSLLLRSCCRGSILSSFQTWQPVCRVKEKNKRWKRTKIVWTRKIYHQKALSTWMGASRKAGFLVHLTVNSQTNQGVS